MTNLFPVPAENDQVMYIIYKYSILVMVGILVAGLCNVLGWGAVGMTLGVIAGQIVGFLITEGIEKRARRKVDMESLVP